MAYTPRIADRERRCPGSMLVACCGIPEVRSLIKTLMPCESVRKSDGYIRASATGATLLIPLGLDCVRLKGLSADWQSRRSDHTEPSSRFDREQRKVREESDRQRSLAATCSNICNAMEPYRLIGEHSPEFAPYHEGSAFDRREQLSCYRRCIGACGSVLKVQNREKRKVMVCG
jgi:hypothetical protein